jgi:hypothetical protein
MRVCLCFNIKGRPAKLVWFNEDKQGVYIGYYGEIGPSHFSYHKDGKTHFKLKLKSKKPQIINESQLLPINDISNYTQILFAGLSITQPFVSDYKKDIKMTSEIFLPDRVLSKQFAIDSYLVCKTKEEEFLQRKFYFYEEKGHYNWLNLNLFVLENFPNHKLALLFLSIKD